MPNLILPKSNYRQAWYFLTDLDFDNGHTFLCSEICPTILRSVVQLLISYTWKFLNIMCNQVFVSTRNYIQMSAWIQIIHFKFIWIFNSIVIKISCEPCKICTVGHYSVQIIQACLFREHHAALSEYVCQSVKDYAVGLLVVSASPPTLLVQILHGLAHRVVDHKADIGLINAHSKCCGGHHYLSQTHNE